MSEQIIVSITNNTGGNADFVLFYAELDSNSCSAACSLAPGDTSGSILTVPVPNTYEYWALSVLVKDGNNAGYYVNQGGGSTQWYLNQGDGSTQWYECALDEGSYNFEVSPSTLAFDQSESVAMQKIAPRPDTTAPAISHVFVVMLENRSFDHMLAFSQIEGITAATTLDSNSYMFAIPTGPGNPLPTTCHVRKGNRTTMPTDPGHEFPDVVTQLCGQFATFDSATGYPPVNNSGFLASYATSTTEAPYQPPMQDQWPAIMTCFNSPTDLPILTTLATNFAVCDHWFASMPGPTWPNRFFLHAASSDGFDYSPTTEQMEAWEGSDGEGLTFPNGTIFDQLAAKSIPYQLYQDYTDDWASYYAADSSYEDASGAVPQAGALYGVSLLQFCKLDGLAADLQNPYPYPYTFIEPHYGDTYDGTYTGGSSQHPMDEVYGGENLLAGVYNAIRSSPYWQSSLLIICYDEHGGFYDSVEPGTCHAPGDKTPPANNHYGFNFTQYGVRVPAVLVSPLIPANTVSQTVYDHTSVSKLLSQLWGTTTMTDRDGNAESPLGLLSCATPRTDEVVLPSPASPTGSTNQLSSAARAARLSEPLPSSGNEIGTLMVLFKTDLEVTALLGAADKGGSEALMRETIRERVRAVRTRGDADAYAREVFEKVRAYRALHPKAAKPDARVKPAAPAKPKAPAEPSAHKPLVDAH